MLLGSILESAIPLCMDYTYHSNLIIFLLKFRFSYSCQHNKVFVLENWKYKFQFLLELVKFTPAYNRDRPALLEIRLTIPPQTGASISIEFEKVFLDWTDHPPDSHHGYYIG